MSEPSLEIKIRRLPNAAGLPLPVPATSASAGADLVAAIADSLVIASGARALVPTGFALALPTSSEAQIRPRSGLALKAGITVLNSPGTIDADYRGEISVLLINHGQEAFTVRRGDRIAQLVVQRLPAYHWREVTVLNETARGAGGYGSTGQRVETNTAGTSVRPVD